MIQKDSIQEDALRHQANENSESDRGKSRRVVLLTFGSLGDLHPYIALALELRVRGHRPVIAANGSHRPIVEAEGIPFHAVRPDISDFGTETDVMKKVMDLRAGPEYVIRKLLMPNLRASYDDITAVCAGADLLVSHPLTLAAPLVAEKKRAEGMAWASIGIAPSAFLSAYDPPVFAPAQGLIHLRVLGPGFYGKLLRVLTGSTRSWVEPWHTFRKEIDLPPTSVNPMFDGQFSPQLVLALFSPLLAAPQSDWPAHTVVTGFPFYDRRGREASLSPDLEAFLAAGEPPIVFTLGSSAVMDAGNFYAQSAEAAWRLGKRAVLLVGRDPRNRPDAPTEGVGVFEYAPFSLVLPRAAAVVHQGGVGTTAQAMRSGRPMLVVPFAFDQPDNAARVTRLGIARTLSRSRYTTDHATRELKALLSDTRYAQRAADVSRQVQAENGAGAACDALETLLGVPVYGIAG